MSEKPKSDFWEIRLGIFFPFCISLASNNSNLAPLHSLEMTVTMFDTFYSLWVDHSFDKNNFGLT